MRFDVTTLAPKYASIVAYPGSFWYKTQLFFGLLGAYPFFPDFVSAMAVSVSKQRG
jgi:hypothetical protein